MKIRMKDAGESPDFGAFQAGDEIDDSRASIETLRLLVDRGLADIVPLPSSGGKDRPSLSEVEGVRGGSHSALRTPHSALEKKED